MNILYTTTANATGDGRNGHAELEDGSVSFEMRIPTEMVAPVAARTPSSCSRLVTRRASTPR